MGKGSHHDISLGRGRLARVTGPKGQGAEQKDFAHKARPFFRALRQFQCRSGRASTTYVTGQATLYNALLQAVRARELTFLPFEAIDGVKDAATTGTQPAIPRKKNLRISSQAIARAAAGATCRISISRSTSPTAVTTLRISFESIAPMQPTRKVSTWVSLPG